MTVMSPFQCAYELATLWAAVAVAAVAVNERTGVSRGESGGRSRRDLRARKDLSVAP